MTDARSTCWEVIQGAAAGDQDQRDRFVVVYGPVVRSYLGARWRSSRQSEDLDDAVQEVYLECFKRGGVLAAADPDRQSEFRAFLLSVVRHVAQRWEARTARRLRRHAEGAAELQGVPANETSLSKVFDRAWARTLVHEAVRLLEERARTEDSARRLELLRLRFRSNLPIREIATQWGEEREVLYREMAKAKADFQAALWEVIQAHHPDHQDAARRQYRELVMLFA